MHNYTQMNTTLTKWITILNTFIKSDILTQSLTPHKNHVKIFENQKMNAGTQNPQTIYYISLIYFFHQIFVLSEIQTHFYIQPQIFSPSKFELFSLKNLKIWTSQNPSWHIIPNPN